MSIGNQSAAFDIRMPLGSNSSWTLSMYQADGISPFVIAGHTFEYLVSTAPPGASPSGTVVIRLRSDVPASPTPAGGGLINVISSAVQSAVQFAMYPPATTPLSAQTYYHALWMDYADPANAYNLFWGQLMLDPAVQP
jgi:hypothetical protein